jgi:hypothetical protein
VVLRMVVAMRYVHWLVVVFGEEGGAGGSDFGDRGGVGGGGGDGDDR